METKCFVEITILALWKEQGMHHICIYAKGYAVDSNKNVLFIFSKYLWEYSAEMPEEIVIIFSFSGFYFFFYVLEKERS